MKPKYIFIATTGTALLTTITFTKYLLKNRSNDAAISLVATYKNKVSEFPAAPLSSPDSVADALQLAHTITKDSPVNKEALREMRDSVHEPKASYEKVLSAYQEAISSYEQLSQNFDLKLRQGAGLEDLAQLDQQLQSQAQKILVLQKESNDAYAELMTQFDQAMPAILEKYF